MQASGCHHKAHTASSKLFNLGYDLRYLLENLILILNQSFPGKSPAPAGKCELHMIVIPSSDFSQISLLLADTFVVDACTALESGHNKNTSSSTSLNFQLKFAWKQNVS